MIVVNNLAKSYVILSSSFRKKILDLLYAILKVSGKSSRRTIKFPYSRNFYALKDISFQVKPNSILGVIGLNGSGKSTLLKILSGHLLSSAGFCSSNPEDIQLVDESSVNLSNDKTVRAEIADALACFPMTERQHKMATILSFFDLEEKKDESVGSLSLGTKSRLIFALATLSVKPILLIDEILGAGDPYWLNRCYYWLKNFTIHNKTVIMTSHDTQLLQRFCDQGLWIDDGKVKKMGPIDQVTASYEAYAYSLMFEGHSVHQEIFQEPDKIIIDKFDEPASMKIRSNNRLIIQECRVTTPDSAITIKSDMISQVHSPLKIKSIKSISVDIISNQNDLYWPTLLCTLWSSNGWRWATFQNKSFEIALKAKELITINIDDIDLPMYPATTYLTLSLFSSETMMTSVEDIAREDFWHKFIAITPPVDIKSGQNQLDTQVSPFYDNQKIETIKIL